MEKKFNVIDFIIIVLVLGAIIAMVVRYNLVEKLVTDDVRDEVEISFLATGISPEIASGITDGSEYFTESNGMSVGELLSHTVTDSKIVISNEYGQPVVSSDKTKKDVSGVLKSGGVMTEDGFMLDGVTFVCAGKNLKIQSLNGQFSVIITEIKLSNGN